MGRLQCAFVCKNVIILVSMPENSFLSRFLLRNKTWKTMSDIFLLQLTVSNQFMAILNFSVCSALHGWIFDKWSCEVISGLWLLSVQSLSSLTVMTFHSNVTTKPQAKLGNLFQVSWCGCCTFFNKQRSRKEEASNLSFKCFTRLFYKKEEIWILR